MSLVASQSYQVGKTIEKYSTERSSVLVKKS